MELPENVTGIVADSAFSSPYDIIKKENPHNISLQRESDYGINRDLESFLCTLWAENIVCAGSNERKYDSGTVGARNGRQ